MLRYLKGIFDALSFVFPVPVGRDRGPGNESSGPQVSEGSAFCLLEDFCGGGGREGWLVQTMSNRVYKSRL